MSYLFLMGKKTVSTIINETSRAIHTALKDTYFNPPRSASQWKKISEEFAQKWQFPHVLGAIDGKHIRIKAPKRSGTNYHNYKVFLVYNCWLIVMRTTNSYLRMSVQCLLSLYFFFSSTSTSFLLINFRYYYGL